MGALITPRLIEKHFNLVLAQMGVEWRLTGWTLDDNAIGIQLKILQYHVTRLVALGWHRRCHDFGTGLCHSLSILRRSVVAVPKDNSGCNGASSKRCKGRFGRLGRC